MIRRALDFAWYVMVILSAAVALVLAYWTWAPIKTVYAPLGGDSADYEVHSIYVTRHALITQTVLLHIDREIVQHDAAGEITLRVGLPSSEVEYQPGEHHQTRLIELPAFVPPGQYLLLSTISWQANPVRRGLLHLPSLPLMIPGRS